MPIPRFIVRYHFGKDEELSHYIYADSIDDARNQAAQDFALSKEEGRGVVFLNANLYGENVRHIINAENVHYIVVYPAEE